jgi:hypothetical protein
LSKRAIINWGKKIQSPGLTPEPCGYYPKTNNQQLLRNKLKLKYKLNLRFETQINNWVLTRKLKTRI